MRYFHGTDPAAGAAIAAAGVLAPTDQTGHRCYVTDDRELVVNYVLRAVVRLRHSDPTTPPTGAVVILAGEADDVTPDARRAPHEFIVLRPLQVEQVIPLDLSTAPALRIPILGRIAVASSAWARRTSCPSCGSTVTTPGSCSHTCRDNLARLTRERTTT